MTLEQMRAELGDCRAQVSHAHQYVREIRESADALDVALTAAKARIKAIDTELHSKILFEKTPDRKLTGPETPVNASEADSAA